MGLSEHSTVEEVSEATRQWYDLAESEFIDMMGLDDTESVAYRGRADGPSFAQKFPTDSKSSAHGGALRIAKMALNGYMGHGAAAVSQADGPINRPVQASNRTALEDAQPSHR